MQIFVIKEYSNFVFRMIIYNDGYQVFNKLENSLGLRNRFLG